MPKSDGRYVVQIRWLTAIANAGPDGTPTATRPAAIAASPTPTLPGTGTSAANSDAAAATNSADP